MPLPPDIWIRARGAAEADDPTAVLGSSSPVWHAVGSDRYLRETAARDVHCRSRWFNGNRVSPSPLGPDAPRRLGWMIGAARDCSRARKRVARRKRSLDRLVERAFSLRTPFAPRPLPG